ncbi:histone deacetylase HDT1-like isoform X2 [Prosopis cineraria]|uniref:histone deacetylase HDT1-like isoform X2 n=1 Tax=Prosopis cineraria TaxID=364024 RepID=UPI0024107BF9|nr:histone deacetylase HDT1-like isoform X2 [Prosopis cineraria]
MEFWGVEVKAGAPVEVDPDDFDKCIHLSQAALGEAKNKASEPVILYLKFGDQKLVLGTLSQEKFPQLSFDLVLEKKFELSHNWKHGSVYFCGYKAELPGEIDEDFTDSEDDEDIPVMTRDNAKPDIKPEVAKAAASKSNDVKLADSKKQVKVVDPKKDEDESEDDEDDESDDEVDDDSSDEEMVGGLVDGGDDESDEDDDETPPKKAKKRPNDSAMKTPVPAKKAKSATPQKTDGKKGGHVATPHPLKKEGKTPKSDQTPKSGGQFACKSCSKTFTSEGGLQQHSKAKHGGQ